MNIPEEIKLKRKELKETQEQFGKRFSVSQASVSDWEAGKTEAPYKVIEFAHACPNTVVTLHHNCCHNENWYYGLS